MYKYWENYDHIYTGTLEKQMKTAEAELRHLYIRFGESPPADFQGHPLTTNDVVVLYRNGRGAAFCIDNGYFFEAPEFIRAPYRYYSTQRPIDIGTFPKTNGGPHSFANYTQRVYVENGTRQAWGYLAYREPLNEKEIDDYELYAASGNPDNVRVPPHQLALQQKVTAELDKIPKKSKPAPLKIAEQIANAEKMARHNLSAPVKNHDAPSRAER
jgi:hypothetical protein